MIKIENDDDDDDVRRRGLHSMVSRMSTMPKRRGVEDVNGVAGADDLDVVAGVSDVGVVLGGGHGQRSRFSR